MRSFSWSLTVSVVLSIGGGATAQDSTPPEKQFLAFIKAQASALRANDQPPADANEWQQRRTKLRKTCCALGRFSGDPV